jgi:hypothetical protein
MYWASPHKHSKKTNTILNQVNFIWDRRKFSFHQKVHPINMAWQHSIAAANISAAALANDL